MWMQEYKLLKLKELAEKFNCDVLMVKKKIKNLLTAFHHQHKNLTQEKSGFLTIKRNKWVAYYS